MRNDHMEEDSEISDTEPELSEAIKNDTKIIRPLTKYEIPSQPSRRSKRTKPEIDFSEENMTKRGYGVSFFPTEAGPQRKRVNNKQSSQKNSDEDDPNWEESPMVKKNQKVGQKHSSEESSDEEDPDWKKYHTSKKKKAYQKVEHILCVQSAPVSAYEKMIQAKKAEQMAFLKSLGINEAKLELSEAVKSYQTKIRKPCCKNKKSKKESPSGPIRKSNRAKIQVDFSEDTLTKKGEGTSIYITKEEEPLPSELTFKKALQSHYHSYAESVNDFDVKESKLAPTTVSYDKTVLNALSLSRSNIQKIVPNMFLSLSWHPSVENLIVAAGDIRGNCGIWNIEESESLPYLFKIHRRVILCMQFNQYNSNQLISVSYDGTMRCCDLEKCVFSEIFKDSDGAGCTYFDCLGPMTYIVCNTKGEVSIVDQRNKSSRVKRHTCHENDINTVHVDPAGKTYFVTASRGFSAVPLWDLRKLQNEPIAEMWHKTTVNAAFFSPVTGHSVLTTSADGTICIFETTSRTHVKLKQRMKYKYWPNKHHHLHCTTASWIPNSDEFFTLGFPNEPGESAFKTRRRIQVFDEYMDSYYEITDEKFVAMPTVHLFHPYRAALASGNTNGRLNVFT